ncbi:MAG: hypothetical protein Q9174_001106 [Haloplaca sp. 1 TL-2023]
MADASLIHQGDLLREILVTLKSVQSGYDQLSLTVQKIGVHIDLLANSEHETTRKEGPNTGGPAKSALISDPKIAPGHPAVGETLNEVTNDKTEPAQRQSATGTSRIILTTYPGQSGIDPINMDWGQADPLQRGPVVVSRSQSTVRRRNAIGAHGGSYSVYHALAVASKNLDVDYRPDFTNTEPAVDLGPFPQWSNAQKIVSLDPWGHLSPWVFSSVARDEDIHVRPTIAITKAHMKLPELEQSVRDGRLVPDGKICLNATGEVAVTKFAVEPVWYLPGVAERFGIDEGTLRRSLFENTGGSFPELITRGDMKLFLPPIGGLTVYCFGDPAKMSDPNVKLALRIHDECNGSDVFGSDICTCRPYLIFGVEEAVKEAQNGGSGVVVYFRKEGRALGEVTKYLVYNARMQPIRQQFW